MRRMSLLTIRQCRIEFESVIQFIELPLFTRDAATILGEEGYREFQLYLAEQPETGDLIPGGKGLRKIRWAASGRGKRGGARIIYYFRSASGRCYLLAIYAKNTASDLSKQQLKSLASILSHLT
jgi:hypothetical protein